MSWASKMIGKARSSTDSLGSALGLSDTQRKYFRYGVSSMGGGMGLQYEYSRNKGMNSDEATKNATTGGASYSEARGMQQARVAEDAATEQAFEMSRVMAAEQNKERLSKEVRVRRARRAELPGNKNGTLLTGALGLGSLGGGSATLGA